MAMETILLKNCRFILQHPRKPLLENASIYIEDQKIEYIGHNHPKADIVIDCRKLLAMPPLVNAHTHAAMSLFRGFAEDMKLEDWLEKIWGIEAKLKSWHVRAGTKLAAVEMALSGIGTVIDMYFYTEEAAKAYYDVGMRAVLTSGFFDFMDSSRTEKALKSAEDHIKSISYLGYETIKPALGPHAIYTCSKELLEGIRELSNKYKVHVHMHLAETMNSQKKCLELYNMREVVFLDKIGLLSSNSSFAHGIYLDDTEIAILSKKGATIVHNPVSNMKLATGEIAPIRELLDKGVNVALGTDGPGSGNRIDMFESMKLAALLQRHKYSDPQIIKVEEILEMASFNGYKAFNIKGGVIKEGFPADILLLNLEKPHMMPAFKERILPNIVYSSQPSDVHSLIINGKIIIENNRIRTVKLEDVKREFYKAAEDLFYS